MVSAWGGPRHTVFRVGPLADVAIGIPIVDAFVVAVVF
jgi:hypothetical protein